MGHRQPKSIDWPRLKIEWLNSDETLNQFRLRHKFPESYFYQTVKKVGWENAKTKILQRAEQKVANGLVKSTAKDWSQYHKVQNNLIKVIASVLEGVMDEHGEVRGDLPPEEIKRIASAFKDATVNKSFLEGGPTERVEQKSLHYEIVQMIKEAEEAKNG